MGTPERYLGTWLQLVDDKNRVSIPARLRETVVANTDPAKFEKSGAYVLIAKHPEFPCLIGFDATWLEDEIAYAAEQRRASPQGGGHFAKMQTLAGGAEQAAFDSTGRCVLSATQKRIGGIDKQAFFLGAVFNFEIWDPKVLLGCAEAADVAKDYCRSALQEKGLL